MPEYPEAKHEFAVNPSGPVPYSGFQVFGIFSVAFFPALALTACGLRVYSRRLTQGLGLDDWLMFLAAALGIPQAVFTAFVIRAGSWGIHDADLPPGTPLNNGLFWSYLNRVFYMPILVLVKISALLFLLKLGGTKTSVRLACKGIIWFCLAQLLAFLPATVFMCEPVDFAWLGSAEGRCFHGDYFAAALASTNIYTDIMALLIPFVAFLGLKLSNKIRFAILAVFTLGFIVTIISVLRLYFIVQLWYFTPQDTHYSLGYTLNTIEVNLAIVTATMPTLWPLARRWFPAVFESMGINRPYLHPDIEVGYVLSQPRASQQQVPVVSATAAAQARPALRGRILWLQRPRPPSFLRPTTTGGGGGGGGDGGGSCIGLTDIRGQRVLGATAGRKNRRFTVESGDEEEDGFEDYHGIIRRTEASLVQHAEEDDSSTYHKPLGSEAARSSPDLGG
ncbi:hypothetical protein C8A01DRAFT_33464 [Parachaetomium inaequale]|uniref:Rhodopsin domain-containing protein n=1 Tax=Parachaetomium inaequale TaxID=2588326 RepID=A0AAN6PKE7_9PEZI|nr:hypothetical protein C8A01DRAFT_33464 [Parachaetomium inaequale]